MFYVHSSNITEYENRKIPKIDLTAEEPPWDTLNEEYSDKETHMTDFQGQIIVPAMTAREQRLISEVILHSLSYEDADIFE